MTSMHTWLDRLLLLLLISALAACDTGSQQVQMEEPTSEQPAEPADVPEVEEDPISRVGNEIFLAEDPDAFDPGVPVGDRFPDIRARFQGEEITSIDRFIKDKGAIFIASRSVDW